MFCQDLNIKWGIIFWGKNLEFIFGHIQNTFLFKQSRLIQTIVYSQFYRLINQGICKCFHLSPYVLDCLISPVFLYGTLGILFPLWCVKSYPCFRCLDLMCRPQRSKFISWSHRLDQNPLPTPQLRSPHMIVNSL